ncbi:DUF5694 domain-containing protein [Sphingorhabdus arenilitoris]|uniref:DUF5694 domain-containing protein n=1 Tax=Sphingorhabdus arenilitoris TaxID=1490041 RepID=A0ABV8RE79_9SPHN
MRVLISFIALLCATSVAAQTPAFDPKSWKGEQAGPPTQVLTLGSAHLGQMEQPVTTQMLEPLLDRLAAYNPTVITHEGLSGEQCDIVNRYPARYPNIFNDYCWGTAEAEKATGLTVPAAMAQVEKALIDWPSKPSAAQRRHLAALFLAAGDRPSAQVQWLQLPMAERKEGNGVDGALLKILQRDGAKPNETYEIAVNLAVRLGLQRIYAVDDHTADSIYELVDSDFEAAIQKIWSAPTGPDMADYNKKQAQNLESGDIIAYYRALNDPQTQRLLISVDFGNALKDNTPKLYGRQYVAWWETRNLRMVANIRAAFGNHPGARVLNIVGASHKAYYDAYLDMMHEVQLVDVESILK